MTTILRKLIPGVIKRCMRAIDANMTQFFLRNRYSRNNNLGRNIILSKDLKIGKNCIIYSNVIIEKLVELGHNVTISSGALLKYISIGDNSMVDKNVLCVRWGNGSIKIGKESYIGVNNVLDCANNILIGDYVHIAGPSTSIWTHTSAPMVFNSIPLSDLSETHRPTAPVVIENNVWIGGNCTIYPGVTIGKHSVISPNSAVTKNVEPYTMVGGVPGRVIKKIEIQKTTIKS